LKYQGCAQQEGKIRVGHTWWVLVACEELTKGGGLAALGQPSQQKRGERKATQQRPLDSARLDRWQD